MFVTMVGQITGTRNGAPWPPPGHSLDLPDDEAIALVHSQMAVPAVDPETGIELAVRDLTPVEKRVAQRRSLVK